jgi:ankyrin repeat protein
MHLKIFFKIAVLTTCFTQTVSAMGAHKAALGKQLLEAAHYNRIEEVARLLKLGAPINVQDKYGRTSLYVACGNNCEDVAKKLIENKANINLANKDGWTPLYVACWRNCTDVAKLLIENKADINLANKDGWTPLYGACWYNYTDVAKLLIENEADINLTDKDGKTVLDVANWCGSRDIAELIVQRECRKLIKEKQVLQAKRLLAYTQKNNIGLDFILPYASSR